MKPRALTIPISSGSDPELIEIDDAQESVGEIPPDTCEDILFFGKFSEPPPRRRKQKAKR